MPGEPIYLVDGDDELYPVDPAVDSARAYKPIRVPVVYLDSVYYSPAVAVPDPVDYSADSSVAEPVLEPIPVPGPATEPIYLVYG